MVSQLNFFCWRATKALVVLAHACTLMGFPKQMFCPLASPIEQMCTKACVTLESHKRVPGVCTAAGSDPFCPGVETPGQCLLLLHRGGPVTFAALQALLLHAAWNAAIFVGPPRELMFSQICKSEVLEMTPCSTQLINQSVQIGTA